MKLVSRLLASVLLLAVLAGSAAAQRKRDWSFQWYWGAQGGAFYYKTNFQPYYYDPVAGGHWLITAKRTALYVAYEQAWFLTDARVSILEPDGTFNPGNVSFHDMRRLMMGVAAFPVQKRIEPFIGGGFALMEVLNPVVTCASCTTNAQIAQMQDAADNAASKAFFWWMGGLDIKQGRLSIFGHYIVTSAAKGFLIDGNTHTFQGGLRYSLGTSKEGITERQ